MIIMIIIIYRNISSVSPLLCDAFLLQIIFVIVILRHLSTTKVIMAILIIILLNIMVPDYDDDQHLTGLLWSTQNAFGRKY